MPLELTGLHHLTAITADARRNHAFYTGPLGMRLVKRTVNQDDTTAYHLFYGDGAASPGSDITFFEFPVPPERRGTHAIVQTGLRVGGLEAMAFWRERLASHGIALREVERAGRAVLEFQDPEGQRLALVDDGGAGETSPWDRSPVPAASQVRGLGPAMISVPDLRRTEPVLTHVMNMREETAYDDPVDGRRVHVFAMGPGGAAAELHVKIEPDLPFAGQGAGGAHHVAFRTPDMEQLAQWAELTRSVGLRTSGEVERFYFRSLYFREPNGILFEIATDGPGFDADEPQETLGEKLSLPPFLEEQRARIEAGLKPID